MRIHVIEISTEVFHLLQKENSWLVRWLDEKPGSTQKILLENDVYTEFIDRAIAHRQTLDQVVREACAHTEGQSTWPTGNGYDKWAKQSN